MFKPLSLVGLSLGLCTPAFALVGGPVPSGPSGSSPAPTRTASWTSIRVHPSGTAHPTGCQPSPSAVHHGTYTDGLHCGSNFQVMAELKDFNDKVHAFCTHIDHWALGPHSTVSTESPIQLVSEKDQGASGTSGSIIFAFRNHDGTKSTTMDCQMCEKYLSTVSEHGSKCVGSDGKGTTGGLVKEGDFTISAWVKKGVSQEPAVFDS